MRFRFFARFLLIDCGKASRRTRGAISGAFTEGGTPPFNRFH
jgi:hypothetical protein